MTKFETLVLKLLYEILGFQISTSTSSLKIERVRKVREEVEDYLKEKGS
jgi:hypothetical protein